MISESYSIFSILDFIVNPDNHLVESKAVDWKQRGWYHFLDSFAKRKISIYINGQPEEEGSQNNRSDLDLWISADDWQMIASSFFGVINKVRIYKTDLTGDQINLLMNTYRRYQIHCL